MGLAQARPNYPPLPLLGLGGAILGHLPLFMWPPGVGLLIFEQNARKMPLSRVSG